MPESSGGSEIGSFREKFEKERSAELVSEGWTRGRRSSNDNVDCSILTGCDEALNADWLVARAPQHCIRSSSANRDRQETLHYCYLGNDGRFYFRDPTMQRLTHLLGGC